MGRLKGLVAILLVGLTAAAAPTLGFTVTPIAGGGGETLALDSKQVLEQARTGEVSLVLPSTVLVFDLVPDPVAEGATWGLDGVPLGVVTDTVTFRGTANGHPARLAATALGVFAAIFSEDPVFVWPASLDGSGAGPVLHQVERWNDAPRFVGPHGHVTSQVAPTSPAALLAESAPANREARFLIEMDFDLYQKTSLLGLCQPCWVQFQQVWMTWVEFLFEDQTGVSFDITGQFACTTAAMCPYDGNELSVVLDRFAVRWETITWENPHDLGHLLVGKDYPFWMGFAGQGSVGTATGYATSEVATGASPFNLDIVKGLTIAAHEVGHNFDGLHELAAPIPPALGPTGATGTVWTIMDVQHSIHYEFSDGTWQASHNNVARIIATALARLPP